jgi:hypothetical protein
LITAFQAENPKFDLDCSKLPQILGGLRMKNAYEVLRQKELDMSRLQKEVLALRVAAPLLDDSEAGNENQLTLPSPTGPQATNTVQAINDTPQQAGALVWGRRVKNSLSG